MVHSHKTMFAVMLPNSAPAARVNFVAVNPSAVFSRSASTGRFSFTEMLKNALKKDQFVIHTSISPVPLYLLSKAFQIWFCIWFLRKCYRNALAEDEIEFGNFVKEAQRDKEYREVHFFPSSTHAAHFYPLLSAQIFSCRTCSLSP